MFVKGTIKKAGILLSLAFLTLFFGYTYLAFIFFAALVFLLQFFRDPHRAVPEGKGLILASADGRIFNGKIDTIKTVNYDDPLMAYW